MAIPASYQAFLDTWSVEEKTKSAYIQANFDFASLPVPVSASLGVRVVDTDTVSTGYNRVQTGPSTNPIVNFVEGSQDGGYTRHLPSLNLRFEFIPNQLVGRMAASKVMARAAPSQLALRRSIDVVGLTGSRGNPDLKPFEATAYDAGLEWYFSPDSFISATLFRKEISSFIINQSAPETIDGTVYNITRPINGTDQVNINGLEIGGQYAFDFLPAPFNGLGVLANYTYQKDKGFKGTNQLTGEILPFPGLSRKSYNVSLYYENEKFSVRRFVQLARPVADHPDRPRQPARVQRSLRLAGRLGQLQRHRQDHRLPGRGEPDRRGADREQQRRPPHRQRDLRLTLLLRRAGEVLATGRASG